MCPAGSRLIFDVISFICFVIGGGMFASRYLANQDDTAGSAFDGQVVPIVILYFGLSYVRSPFTSAHFFKLLLTSHSLTHFVMGIYDCVDAFKKKNGDVEAVVGESSAIPTESHQAVRTQRVCS
jgi:hypothetical protein